MMTKNFAFKNNLALVGCNSICGTKNLESFAQQVLVFFFLYFNLKQKLFYTNNVGHNLNSLISVQQNLILFEKIAFSSIQMKNKSHLHTRIFTYTNTKTSPNNMFICNYTIIRALRVYGFHLEYYFWRKL